MPILINHKLVRRIVVGLLVAAFVTTGVLPLPLARAQQAALLPSTGTRLALSPSFAAPLLKGIKVYRNDPFRFDFILDKGDAHLNSDTNRLIKYFLAALTVPEKDLWVNLSPYEKDRIVPDAFGQTEMGRDLLTQDYILKQITASVIYPEEKIGKEFWVKVYAEAQKRYGTTDIPVDTFNKVWIVPQKATVYENKDAAFVVESHLKVMLDTDYLATSTDGLPTPQPLNAKASQLSTPTPSTQEFTKDIIREIIIPILEKEVNEGQNFAQLRQVYNSLILATWYKRKIMNVLPTRGHVVLLSENDQQNYVSPSSLPTSLPMNMKASQVTDRMPNHPLAYYIDKHKTIGIDIIDKNEKEKIWSQYVESFKKGAYNFVKEEFDPVTQTTLPRKYFSGGADMAMTGVFKVTDTGALPNIPSSQADVVQIKVEMVQTSDLEPLSAVSERLELIKKDIEQNILWGKSRQELVQSKIVFLEQGLQSFRINEMERFFNTVEYLLPWLSKDTQQARHETVQWLLNIVLKQKGISLPVTVIDDLPHLEEITQGVLRPSDNCWLQEWYRSLLENEINLIKRELVLYERGMNLLEAYMRLNNSIVIPSLRYLEVNQELLEKHFPGLQSFGHSVMARVAYEFDLEGMLMPDIFDGVIVLMDRGWMTDQDLQQWNELRDLFRQYHEADSLGEHGLSLLAEFNRRLANMGGLYVLADKVALHRLSATTGSHITKVSNPLKDSIGVSEKLYGQDLNVALTPEYAHYLTHKVLLSRSAENDFFMIDPGVDELFDAVSQLIARTLPRESPIADDFVRLLQNLPSPYVNDFVLNYPEQLRVEVSAIPTRLNIDWESRFNLNPMNTLLVLPELVEELLYAVTKSKDIAKSLLREDKYYLSHAVGFDLAIRAMRLMDNDPRRVAILLGMMLKEGQLSWFKDYRVFKNRLAEWANDPERIKQVDRRMLEKYSLVPIEGSSHPLIISSDTDPSQLTRWITEKHFFDLNAYVPGVVAPRHVIVAASQYFDKELNHHFRYLEVVSIEPFRALTLEESDRYPKGTGSVEGLKNLLEARGIQTDSAMGIGRNKLVRQRRDLEVDILNQQDKPISVNDLIALLKVQEGYGEVNEKDVHLDVYRDERIAGHEKLDKRSKRANVRRIAEVEILDAAVLPIPINVLIQRLRSRDGFAGVKSSEVWGDVRWDKKLNGHPKLIKEADYIASRRAKLVEIFKRQAVPLALSQLIELLRAEVGYGDVKEEDVMTDVTYDDRLRDYMNWQRKLDEEKRLARREKELEILNRLDVPVTINELINFLQSENGYSEVIPKIVRSDVGRDPRLKSHDKLQKESEIVAARRAKEFEILEIQEEQVTVPQLLMKIREVNGFEMTRLGQLESDTIDPLIKGHRNLKKAPDLQIVLDRRDKLLEILDQADGLMTSTQLVKHLKSEEGYADVLAGTVRNDINRDERLSGHKNLIASQEYARAQVSVALADQRVIDYLKAYVRQPLRKRLWGGEFLQMIDGLGIDIPLSPASFYQALPQEIKDHLFSVDRIFRLDGWGRLTVKTKSSFYRVYDFSRLPINGVVWANQIVTPLWDPDGQIAVLEILTQDGRKIEVNAREINVSGVNSGKVVAQFLKGEKVTEVVDSGKSVLDARIANEEAAALMKIIAGYVHSDNEVLLNQYLDFLVSLHELESVLNIDVPEIMEAAADESGINLEEAEDFIEYLLSDDVRAKGIDMKNVSERVAVYFNHDNAMSSVKTPGGIGFNSLQLDIQSQKDDEEGFNVDPAMLRQMEGSAGLVPVVINVMPLNSVYEFLGLAK